MAGYLTPTIIQPQLRHSVEERQKNKLILCDLSISLFCHSNRKMTAKYLSYSGVDNVTSRIMGACNEEESESIS